uniref:Uncharacterized protein n=1 Tax=viral metagenome TaxID=1070528 RepID=A0A6M3J175_9ZZZZ
MEGFQQGLSNLVPLALKAQEIKREDAKAKLDFQMKNEKLQFEKIDFLNKLKEAEAKNVAKNIESLQKAGDIEGLQALIPRAQELGLMVPMSPQPNIPEGLSPPAQPWVEPQEMDTYALKQLIEQSTKARFKEPKEEKLYATEEGFLPTERAIGKKKYEKPEKKTLHERNYEEWAKEPENIGKSIMAFEKEVATGKRAPNWITLVNKLDPRDSRTVRSDSEEAVSLTESGQFTRIEKTEQLVTDPTKPEFRELRTHETNVRDVIDLATNMKKMVAEDPTIIGLTGKMQRAIDRVSNQTALMTRAMGPLDKAIANNAKEQIERITKKYDFSKFGPSAARSAGFRSTAIRLAYVNAKALDPGGRLSKDDIQLSLDALASTQGSPGQLNAAMDVLIKNNIQSFKNHYYTLNSKPLPDGFFGKEPHKQIIKFDAQGNILE